MSSRCACWASWRRGPTSASERCSEARRSPPRCERRSSPWCRRCCAVRSCAASSAACGTASSAAAVGVAARRSAAKSAIVKSVSWPTAEMTGIPEAAIARATASSLKAHSSSREPPPRPTISTSASPIAFRFSMAFTMDGPAPLPCTRTGYSTTATCGNRRCSVMIISRTAAPVGEVTTPMQRGNRGSGRLRAAANSPSSSSLFFSCSYARYRLPIPSGCICVA
ncbi:hypothetical protein D3C73_795720 [compost metagenome]